MNLKNEFIQFRRTTDAHHSAQAALDDKRDARMERVEGLQQLTMVHMMEEDVRRGSASSASLTEPPMPICIRRSTSAMPGSS